MISTSNIRKGLCIQFHHDIYKVLEFLHVKPGKGSAFIRTKLKNLTNGRIIENTFPAGHKIEEIKLISYLHQYLYKDRDGFHFMNLEDYNQVHINQTLIKFPQFLKEGIKLMITYRLDYEIPIFVDMPNNIVLQVIYTEPGIKGDTINNSTKLATLETGVKIQVPLFINIGELIKVNIETGLYLEREKNKV